MSHTQQSHHAGAAGSGAQVAATLSAGATSAGAMSGGAMSGGATAGISVLVTLTVAGQLCAVPVLSVRDVLDDQAITPVPLAPREIAGNLNLRGRIVTAICLRRRLGLPEPAPGQRRMSVVAEQAGEYYALLVDAMGEVLSLDADRFAPTPPTMPAAFAAFAEGIFLLRDRLLLVLSVPRLLAIRADA